MNQHFLIATETVESRPGVFTPKWAIFHRVASGAEWERPSVGHGKKNMVKAAFSQAGSVDITVTSAAASDVFANIDLPPDGHSCLLLVPEDQHSRRWFFLSMGEDGQFRPVRVNGHGTPGIIKGVAIHDFLASLADDIAAQGIYPPHTYWVRPFWRVADMLAPEPPAAVGGAG